MSSRIQSRTRNQIRQSIGYNLACMILSACSSDGDTTSLIDTYGLARGGDDEYNGRQVYIYETHGTGNAQAGDKTFVSDFASTAWDATLAPALSGSTKDTKGYEMWSVFLIEEIHDAIDQAIIDATDDCLKVKQLETTYTERDRYEYNVLSNFVGLHTVEYVFEIKEGEVLNACNAAWDSANTANIIVSVDNEMVRRGSYCNKLAVGAGAAAGDLLATDVITETDLSDYDTLELWIYSDTAIAASALECYLDDSAACASPVDTMSLPAITADTWTRCVLSLTNPELDTAIISVGIGQEAATDLGIINIWLDHLLVLKASSRVYKPLNPEYWSIVKGSTNYLQLSQDGKNTTGNDTLLRLTGYQIPAVMTADTATCDIDPAWVIPYTTGVLLTSHAKSARLDIKDRIALGDRYLARADRIKPSIKTKPAMGTRWF